MKKKYKLIEAFILINILIYMLVIFQSSTCFATEKNTFIKRTTIKYVEAIDDEYIQVKWSKVSNADGYQIYRSASKNGTYKRIATVKASKRIYNDKSVKIGKKYYYKVRAYIKKNGKNTYGKFSSTVPEEIVDLNKIEVFVPYPQVPADGTKNADFNAETITCKKIYDYIDSLVAKYPTYLTKETMGKDESGEFDWNRYICYRRYYEGWQKKNYPAMYAWRHDNNVIYSTSVSPRIDDKMYSTAYIGAVYSTVEDVDNANQTRTVNGLIFTREKSEDVDATIVYSVLSGKVGNSVYDSSKTKITSISKITKNKLIGANGITYVRYPLGDRNKAFIKPKVIVIGSNEHGRPQDPAEPAIISARMIKDLCECTNGKNSFFNLLKNDYMIVFLPIINPWGYDDAHKSYYNSNGVNLDRNLDTPGWGNDNSSGNQGAYGGSEVEMQYFMNTLAESGTKIVMANHALGTHFNSNGVSVNAGKCHYMLGRNNSKYSNDLVDIAEFMRKQYNLEFSDYGRAPPETYAKTRSYIDWIGAEGGAIEMQARDNNGNLHTSKVLEADYTLQLKFLYMLLKHAQ